MSNPYGYATKFKAEPGTRVMMRAYYKDAPIVKLAIALRLKIERGHSYLTSEENISITFPFDNFHIEHDLETMGLRVYGEVTSTGNKFSIPDPEFGFPSDLLIARLNLLRS